MSSPQRLGDKIKKAREEHVLTLEDFATQTGVVTKYLEAIEKNNFRDLPKTKTFRIAYLRACANALQLNYKDILKQFEAEGGLNDLESPIMSDRRKNNMFHPSLLPLRNICITITIIIFAGYLGWQIKGIMQQPKLVVYSPYEGAVSNQLSVQVQGESEKEVKLTVNGQDIMINEKGQFESNVDLSNGVNTITITATKKHGRTTTVTRHVVVQNKMTLKN